MACGVCRNIVRISAFANTKNAIKLEYFELPHNLVHVNIIKQYMDDNLAYHTNVIYT